VPGLYGSDMNPTVTGTDFVRTGVLVKFSDGIHAFFNTDFLYSHRNDEGNKALPDEETAESIG
jgi:hypothetical protein